MTTETPPAPPGLLKRVEIARAHMRALETTATAAETAAKAARQRHVEIIGTWQFCRSFYTSHQRYLEPPTESIVESLERAGLPLRPTDAELGAAQQRWDRARQEAWQVKLDAERTQRELAARCEEVGKELATAEAELAAEMDGANLKTARAGGRLLIRHPDRIEHQDLPSVEDV